jgi:hypothetical protein
MCRHLWSIIVALGTRLRHLETTLRLCSTPSFSIVAAIMHSTESIAFPIDIQDLEVAPMLRGVWMFSIFTQQRTRFQTSGTKSSLMLEIPIYNTIILLDTTYAEQLQYPST